MSATLLIAIFASLQVTADLGLALVLPGPLLGSPGPGGDQFDDGITAIIPHVARVSSLTVCHGDVLDGFQATYTLQDGKSFVGFSHGMENSNCTKKIIDFMDNEMITRIEGKIQVSFRYISQMTLFTTIDGGLPSVYGPFGTGTDQDTPFSMAGSPVGFFGRSGQVLDAVGLYINSTVPISLYEKTDPTGGDGGESFDDFSPDVENNPVRISSMIVNHGDRVNGIRVKYMLPDGDFSVVEHGGLSKPFDGVLDFDDDEWITRVNISSGTSRVVDYLYFWTTSSSGAVRSYGPFGKPTATELNMTTIYGVVGGFFGRSGEQLNALGFYV